MSILDQLIAEATSSGGSERANYQLFIAGLCDVLGVPRPTMSQEANARNDYVFERSLDYRHPDGSTTKLYIDCYKRGSFVLEAKQSARRQAEDDRQTSLFGSEANSRKLGHAKRGSRGWDRVMRSAYMQAVDYTRRLPVEHGYPPFVILVDVGHVIELYADFSGQGKNYAQFPDAQSFRIDMEALRDPQIQARLKSVWTDPHSLDPAKKSAEVTRDIAGRLARIAKNLEGKHDARDVAEFLMRCLFTMFAQSAKLLPDGLLVKLLGELVDNPAAFPPAMESLWKTMNTGGFEPHSMASLKHFNGGLFVQPKALPLAPEDIHELLVAARMDWRDVEPAIFGTLLERALDSRERSKLGAHYTPRAYVERLVVPTIIEPLRADWKQAQVLATDLQTRGNELGALNAVRAFHRKLCSTRVLDPACGTGNFLYVSLELMKKLEGEVLDAIRALGGRPDRYRDYPEELGATEVGRRLSRTGGVFTVDPHQFYGLELNPRAVPIADLVVWIGYLKWQLRTVGSDEIAEPVLEKYDTIREADALLAFDRRELARDNKGAPITVWDGVTHMRHPVTGKLVPDTAAQKEAYQYYNPRPAPWPAAEFIVGNPPFIGNKLLRRRLGSGYVEALYSAYRDLPNSLDLVTYWWSKAARAVLRGEARAFGFVTTKTIAQISNRPVLSHFLGHDGFGLSFAVANHPWIDSANTAAVRVAFTSGTKVRSGRLLTPVTEKRSVREEPPIVELRDTEGRINADLTIGVDATVALPLRSNFELSFQGVKLGHDDFQIDHSTAAKLQGFHGAGPTIRGFIGGDQIKDGAPSGWVIDLFGKSNDEVKTVYPAIFQYLSDHVLPHKSQVDRASHRDRWWQFGEPRPDMRNALADLRRYICTVEVSKHRYFVSIPWPEVLLDGSAIAIATDSYSVYSVLHALPHQSWAQRVGGRMGVGNDPRYQNSLVFERFPFPDLSSNPTTDSRLAELAELGERLDAFRKERLAAHDFLTMTGLYNVLERIRELDWKSGPGRHSESAAQIEPLTDKERDIYDSGHIAILKDIHDEIDTLVFAAYGWSDLAPRLVGRPGATTPSPCKTDDQLAAEEELLTRLVALNQERAAEEARGLVRWLRPHYQIPKLGHKVARPDGVQVEADLAIIPVSDKPKWPTSDTEQINILVDLLRRAPAPVPPEALAATFDGRNTPKRRERIQSLLETLTIVGLARAGRVDGEPRYFIPR
ncbi:MAG: class I SAM-dependent DNA methyltransferase [Devosia sp.]|nr:class I SAM-dependent DNA methyltransferase [Devosia sp.]